jgi:hypothetical protein
MARAILGGHRVRQLLLIFLAVVRAFGKNLYTALKRLWLATDRIQENTLQANGEKAC